ncbi:unnamed protein product [Caenorhabditis auriculariae]|uniref:C6 domain-containing protein n=1 Tax=Caenorhabditis auriculariae TaxID=2777116 RepID=A0A8S1HG37_9PELO|nr:unnamed protein product [Caenorhabditis auriculariae]
MRTVPSDTATTPVTAAPTVTSTITEATTTPTTQMTSTTTVTTTTTSGCLCKPESLQVTPMEMNEYSPVISGNSCTATVTCTSPTGSCTAALIHNNGAQAGTISDNIGVATFTVMCNAEGLWFYDDEGEPFSDFNGISCADMSTDCN